MTQIEVVVVGVAHGLHHPIAHGHVAEQAHGDGVVLCQHVEGLGVGIVGQGHEGPLVLRHGLLAGEGGTGHLGHHLAVVVDAQGEGAALRVVAAFVLSDVQDGARLMVVQPEVDGEVALQEHGVHRLGLLAEGPQLV